MSNLRPFLPYVLLEMPRNPNFTKFSGHQRPKLDQYWPKPNQFGRMSWYTCIPNSRPFIPCVILRMLGNPNFNKFLGLPKANTLYWANICQNLISSEGDHDTPACQIWCHFFHAFSLKCSETPISLSFLATRGRNWTNIGQNVIISEGGHDAPACQISGHLFHGFSLECPETKNWCSVWWAEAISNGCYFRVPLCLPYRLQGAPLGRVKM